MGLELQAARATAIEAQAYHTGCPLAAGGLTMARPIGQQALETAQLVVEGEGPMGTPLTPLQRAMAIEPGPTLAAQPAAQQAIGEQLGSHGRRLGGDCR